MSVPSWERELSDVQYIYELFQFNKRLGQIVMNHPKKYRENYGDHLIQASLDSLKHAQAANAIFMSTNTSENDYLRRRQHLQSALALIDHTSTVADIFLSLVSEQDGVKLEKLERQQLDIGSQSKIIHDLIRGVMDSDTQIFKGQKKPKPVDRKR